MRLLAFAASLREASLNGKLISVAAALAREAGAAVEVAPFRAFEMPVYDGDLEASDGLPPGALELQRRLAQVDGLMIAAPEYNYSISGALKNAIDWVSRARPMPWRGKSVLLLAASPSEMGGIRGLWQTRIPLEGCGALVFPDMFALAAAHRAFDEAGNLRDPQVAERLRAQVAGFVRLAESVAPVCAGVADQAARARQAEIAAALEEQSQIQQQAT